MQNTQQLLQDHFKEMTSGATHLFEINLDKDELWNLYLDSFPQGTNEIFRKRRQYDCSCCRQFIKHIGNVVAIKNNKVVSVWDVNSNNTTFQPVFDALSAFVKSQAITDVWATKLLSVGADKNFEQTENGVIEWEHFYLKLPSAYVTKSFQSIGDIKGTFRDTKNVFKRSLDEITEDSVLTVLELISQNSLYKGEEWKAVLTEFLSYQRKYHALTSDSLKDVFVWEQSIQAGMVIGRIRNHSIGTLLINISAGIDLDEAVRKYEVMVAPTNYKRPKAIFTQKMLDDAKKTIAELGYLDSLSRRYATIDDITVNNILFSNKDSAKSSFDNSLDVFSELSKETKINPKRFSKVEEITVDNFITNVLPTAHSLEVFLENKQANNLVSLIAPIHKESKSMFKWDNAFSWAYSGNITDSNMKENVKSAGGNVEGVLRFSIQWNDMGDYDGNDLDAHCIEPSLNHISFRNKDNRLTTGRLDVDIINPTYNKPAVENITWTNLDKMHEGNYLFYVNNYSHRGGKNGFRAEIEFEGQIYSFDYSKEIKYNEDVYVAEVTLSKTTGFEIKELLDSNVSQKELWNLKTNNFVPVSSVMFSPNYWNEQGVGHRHYFFMLKDCVNPESPNSFYNEFLKSELLTQKRVFEALGSKLRVPHTTEQLSGLGFSSTKRNELIVKVIGHTERVLKIKF